MRYPKELFSANEDVTKENLTRYNKFMDRVYDRILLLYPDYYTKDARERHKIFTEIKDSVKSDYVNGRYRKR